MGRESEKDINEMFRDEEVKAIFCISGGFNSNVVFEYLNYDFIRNHPKIICGFSDSTSLTNNIYSQTGVVTFSGPTFKALTSWQTQYGYEEVIKRFVEGGLVLGQADDKYKTIKEGKRFSNSIGLVTEPIVAIKRILKIPAHKSAELYFIISEQ